jgi:hypothetical protein
MRKAGGGATAFVGALVVTGTGGGAGSTFVGGGADAHETSANASQRTCITA